MKKITLYSSQLSFLSFLEISHGRLQNLVLGLFKAVVLGFGEYVMKLMTVHVLS